MREHIIDLADNLWGVHSKVCEHKLEEHTDVCLLGHADESCCEGCEYRLTPKVYEATIDLLRESYHYFYDDIIVEEWDVDLPGENTEEKEIHLYYFHPYPGKEDLSLKKLYGEELFTSIIFQD